MLHSTYTSALCAFLFASSSAMAATLLVGSNDGPIVSYSLNGNSLAQISSNSDSAPAASWQTVTPKFIFSVSETGGTDPGTITAFTISGGVLKKVGSDKGLPGPVNIAVAESGSMLIVAAYGGHGITAMNVSSTGVVKVTATLPFTDRSIDPVRQTASFPHQVVVDPTTKFAVVPDLGADLIRIFRISNGALTPIQNVVAHKGSGPRHGVFWPRKAGIKPSHYFLVSEMASSVTTYKVLYSADGLNMTFSETMDSKVYSTFGSAVKPGAAGGEIVISPDNRFLYVSNRLDKTFSTSDSIATWSINSDSTLNFICLTPSGGLSPRHISLDTLNGKDYMTVANPTSGDVAMFTRDVATGQLGTTPFASAKVSGAACVNWVL